jgi:hypothetical protein
VQWQRRQAAALQLLLLLLLLLLQPPQHLLPQLLPLRHRICSIPVGAAAGRISPVRRRWCLLLLLLLCCQGVHEVHHGQLLFQLLNLPATPNHSIAQHSRKAWVTHASA